jgi:hypothetical protein
MIPLKGHAQGTPEPGAEKQTRVYPNSDQVICEVCQAHDIGGR